MNAVLTELMERALRGDLQKLVFSRPRDAAVLRTVATPRLIRGQTMLQCETFCRDGKALHRNLTLSEAPAILAGMAETDYRQTDLFCGNGTAEIRFTAKGKLLLSDKLGRTRGASAQGASGQDTSDRSTSERGALGQGASAAIAPPAPHDTEKQYLLSDKEVHPFLVLLGVSDRDGRIFDKKRAKFRQINRFLELLADTVPALPQGGVLTVCDLCCGKSYLTFAVYWYLTERLHREVRMYGVDRKADVMEFCADAAQTLGYTGMHFTCGDILDFTPPAQPDLVISLHACDIATDVVLAEAIRQRARVILSTPCCQHEMAGQIACPTLAFLTKHSILKQKLCDAATDALRAKRLEAAGYAVTALELIDPEETPKNVMLRAILPKHPVLPALRAKALAEYRDACAFLGVSPALDRLLEQTLPEQVKPEQHLPEQASSEQCPSGQSFSPQTDFLPEVNPHD